MFIELHLVSNMLSSIGASCQDYSNTSVGCCSKEPHTAPMELVVLAIKGFSIDMPLLRSS